MLLLQILTVLSWLLVSLNLSNLFSCSRELTVNIILDFALSSRNSHGKDNVRHAEGYPSL